MFLRTSANGYPVVSLPRGVLLARQEPSSESCGVAVPIEQTGDENLSNPAQLLSVDDYPQRLRQWKPVKAREEVEGLAYQTARLIQEGQLNKPDAVDRLREIALGSGVYDDLGDDAECFIQADLTAGFAAFELDRDRTCGVCSCWLRRSARYRSLPMRDGRWPAGYGDQASISRALRHRRSIMATKLTRSRCM
jgi:hypothetical protein